VIPNETALLTLSAQQEWKYFIFAQFDDFAQHEWNGKVCCFHFGKAKATSQIPIEWDMK